MKPRALIAVAYEEWAREYQRSLPPEHYMESTGQSTQRKITLESLDLVKRRRPDIHVFSELLVQYPRRRQKRPGQVVPDNMVVVSSKPPRAESSYNLPLEPARPYWVLEYVSKNNKRKDYDDNFDKYEQELYVPYYLVFYPDDQELTLYRLHDEKYISVKPNKHGRYPVATLDIEVALLNGWVRFWYQGQLLPLPADLELALEEAVRRADEEKRRADEERGRADELQRRLTQMERELADLRAASPQTPRRRNNGA